LRGTDERPADAEGDEIAVAGVCVMFPALTKAVAA
jgi:hypothetical protein